MFCHGKSTMINNIVLFVSVASISSDKAKNLSNVMVYTQISNLNIPFKYSRRRAALSESYSRLYRQHRHAWALACLCCQFTPFLPKKEWHNSATYTKCFSTAVNPFVDRRMKRVKLPLHKSSALQHFENEPQPCAVFCLHGNHMPNERGFQVRKYWRA